MNNTAGIWIDHREATIVVLTEAGEETIHVHSGATDNGSSDSQQTAADDSRERAHVGHLARFYDEVIAHVSNAESILIFGPGEAKGELKKRFEKHPNGTRTLATSAADKMTEPQIVALVRHHFNRDPARL